MTDRDVSDDGSTETETNTFTVLFDEGMVFIFFWKNDYILL